MGACQNFLCYEKKMKRACARTAIARLVSVSSTVDLQNETDRIRGKKPTDGDHGCLFLFVIR
jgi:hypothetical protein